MRPQRQVPADAVTCPTRSPSTASLCFSSVLNSNRAVQVNILIVRAFVKLREVMSTHKDLARELADLKRTTGEHGVHIQKIYTIIEKLVEPPQEPKRRIGFRGPDQE